MLKEYYNKRKKGMLPFIKDFTKPQSHWHKKNVNKLTWKEWFWMHPSSYQLIHYGNNTLSIIIYTAGIIILQINLLKVILGIFIILNIKELIKKIRHTQGIKNMTFYELYLRE